LRPPRTATSFSESNSEQQPDAGIVSPFAETHRLGKRLAEGEAVVCGTSIRSATT